MTAVSELEARLRGENAALALRQRLDLGYDEANLTAIAGQRGLLVIQHDFGADHPDGMYIFDGTDGLAVINTAKQPRRQRFTFAHELAHHELHRLRRQGPIVDIDIYSTTGPDGAKDLDEVEANSFAAHLLLPRQAILSAIDVRRNGQVTIEDVVELVSRYRVSWEMVCYRLHNEDLIRPIDRDRLKAEPRILTLQAHGISDTYYDLGGPDLPAPLVTGAARLWADWVITDERLAQILETSTADALEHMASSGIERRSVAEQELEAGAEQLIEAGVDLGALVAELAVDDEDHSSSSR